jgi:hypothetical protein
MTAAAPMAFPAGKVLGDWWRQLAPREPVALWVGRLLIHRVEALALVEQRNSLDPVTLHLLRALTVGKTIGAGEEMRYASGSAIAAATLKDIETILGLPSSFVHSLLIGAERHGLVVPDRQVGIVPVNRAAKMWTVTPAGWESLKTGSISRQLCERRIFHFVEGPEADRHPHFIGLTIFNPDMSEHDRHGQIVTHQTNFGTDILEACIAQPSGWKQRWGFPLDVLKILGLDQDHLPQFAGGIEANFWRRVIVDSPGELFVLLLREPQYLRGFAVRPEGWRMLATAPCFMLQDSNWQEVFPCLANDPPMDTWRRAWMTWGKSRNLPGAEMEAAQLERVGVCLRIKVGRKLIEQLQTLRRDAPKGEYWILAGEGPIRAAAQLEFCNL